MSATLPHSPSTQHPAPSPGAYSLKLLRPVADVSAGVAGALPQIPCSADFRAEPAGDAFCDVAGAGVFGTVVLRSANHRLVVVVGVDELFLGSYVLFGPRLRVDVAEYPGTHTVVFSHCGLPTVVTAKLVPCIRPRSCNRRALPSMGCHRRRIVDAGHIRSR